MTEPLRRSVGVLGQVARIGRLLWAERRAYLPGCVFVAISICTAVAYPYVIRLIIDDENSFFHAGRERRPG